MNIHPVVNYFLKGLLLVVPIGLTIYIISAMVVWIDNLIPIKIPGIGILTVLLVTTGVGYIANTIIAKPAIETLNSWIKRIPLAGFIYTSINDLVDAFVGDKKRFDQPVLVPLDEKGEILKPGFITQTDLEEIGLPGKVSVYMPHSYNFSGNLIIIEKSRIILLKGKNTEIMKYIVSGGVSGKIEIK
ncbi:DUF502 domain-containing protein [Marinoscillum sp. MHG1-6]|uniref:DUF502 domain-containing protein n=1 Tax=Marinoscillum sp. MHG1-6 TaxID=2959627 RepID=UPI002158068C|nr:DUF502 domain-containing protein [Marinoscillum sp. MHG1-6]